MTFTIGVVDLGHEVSQGLAVVHALLEAREAVNEGYGIPARESADLARVLIEGVVRVAEFCAGVGRGRQENHLDPGGLGLCDHRLPRRLRTRQADAAVIQTIIDRDHVRPKRQHVVLEPLRATLGILAADGCDDDVHDGVWESLLEPAMEQVRIGIERVHDRRAEVPGRDTVPVTDDVDGPVGGPLARQFRHDTGQVVLRPRAG